MPWQLSRVSRSGGAARLEIFIGFVLRPRCDTSESESASAPVARAREKEKRTVAERCILSRLDIGEKWWKTTRDASEGRV